MCTGDEVSENKSGSNYYCILKPRSRYVTLSADSTKPLARGSQLSCTLSINTASATFVSSLVFTDSEGLKSGAWGEQRGQDAVKLQSLTLLAGMGFRGSGSHLGFKVHFHFGTGFYVLVLRK
jgi:hypothetical protein